jgi:hypothetical protein
MTDHDGYPGRQEVVVTAKAQSPSRFAITPERRDALLIATGAAAGVAQTILLKKFVDGANGVVPTWMPQVPQIGSFNQPSAMLGVALGAVGILAGLYIPLDPKLKNIFVAYGGSAISSAILVGAGIL